MKYRGRKESSEESWWSGGQGTILTFIKKKAVVRKSRMKPLDQIQKEIAVIKLETAGQVRSKIGLMTSITKARNPASHSSDYLLLLN